MDDILVLRSKDHSYLAVPVPKNSRDHRLKLSTQAFQCYISYLSEQESLVYTPYRVQVNAEIIGLASSLSDSLKNLLMKNNIILKDWVGGNTVSADAHDELLIIEVPELEEE